MLHNIALEGLVKIDSVRYDLYSGIAGTKALFSKVFKPFEKRISSLVPNHPVVPAGDGEASTTISVLGFLVDAKIKTCAPQKVELQFLEHHKTLCLALHQEFTKSEYAQQSEAALQNFKTLLMLEITILLGPDIEWATGSTGSAAVADPPVLAPGAAADDGNASISEDSDSPGRAIRNTAATAQDPTIANADDDTCDTGGGAGAPAAPAAAEDADCNVLDMGDFTIWHSDTWVAVDYDKIQFPTDLMHSICSVWSYFAVVMILWHDPTLREKHASMWDGLNAAWKATFHHDLCSSALVNWPEDGPHGFNAAESAWLAGTLCYLKHWQGRPTSTRQRVVPAAAAAAAAAPPPHAETPRRVSSKAQRRHAA